MSSDSNRPSPSLGEGRASLAGGQQRGEGSRARERRKQATKSEGLLWSVLRARQLCGLKFRREHPIGPFIVDFACVSKKLAVEIDGGYHDEIVERDRSRQKLIERAGWDVIRFTAKDVEADAEAVARAIAKHIGIEFSFDRRNGGGSGQKSIRGKRVKDG